MSRKIETYVMTVMTFGASCSPSLANYVRDKNAERFEKDHSYAVHSYAVHSIKSNTFVDDWLQSEDTEDEMVLLCVKYIETAVLKCVIGLVTRGECLKL